MTNAFWGGLVFLAFTLYMLKHAVESFRLYDQSLTWPSIAGKILACDLRLSKHETNLRSLHIRYEYPIEGENLVGVRLSLYTVVHKDEAVELAEQFPEGKTVPVFYQPDNPKQSVLVPGAPKSKKFSDLILAGMAVGVAIGLTTMGYLGVIG